MISYKNGILSSYTDAKKAALPDSIEKMTSSWAKIGASGLFIGIKTLQNAFSNFLCCIGSFMLEIPLGLWLGILMGRDAAVASRSWVISSVSEKWNLLNSMSQGYFTHTEKEPTTESQKALQVIVKETFNNDKSTVLPDISYENVSNCSIAEIKTSPCTFSTFNLNSKNNLNTDTITECKSPITKRKSKFIDARLEKIQKTQQKTQSLGAPKSSNFLPSMNDRDCNDSAIQNPNLSKPFVHWVGNMLKKPVNQSEVKPDIWETTKLASENMTSENMTPNARNISQFHLRKPVAL
jgi:hypothetical protein